MTRPCEGGGIFAARQKKTKTTIKCCQGSNYIDVYLDILSGQLVRQGRSHQSMECFVFWFSASHADCISMVHIRMTIVSVHALRYRAYIVVTTEALYI